MASDQEDIYNQPPVKDPEPSRNQGWIIVRAILFGMLAVALFVVWLLLAPFLGDWRF